MDLFQTILIIIHIAAVFSRRYASSSDESIENLLYYRDCQKAEPKDPPQPAPVPLKAHVEPTPRAYNCQYPKMCCSLSCNNECGGGGSSSMFGMDMNKPMASNQPVFPLRQPQVPMQLPNARSRRKKIKPPLLPPIGSRRGYGFTKERIKGLIAKDNDIRKILKDLVRVTMQKVDLVEMINSRKSAADTKVNKEMSISDDDSDLE